MAAGDNVIEISNPPPPSSRPIGRGGKFSKISCQLIYWILKILFLTSRSIFKAVCNPVTWFVLKTVCHVTSELLIYLILGCCSILIGTINQIDDYYYGKNSTKKKEIARDGLRIENCTVKRFVEIAQ